MAKKTRQQNTAPLPLLFLNGTGCDARIMAQIAPQLGNIKVIYAPMSGTQTAADQASFILAQAPEKFALAGFSLGALVAFEMLAQAPHRVKKLLLINANPRPDRPENAKIRRKAIADFRKNGASGFIIPNWSLQVAPISLAHQQLQDLVIDMAAKVGQAALADQAEIAINRTDNRQRLRNLDVPVTIIYGEQDQICPPDMRAECFAAFKKATMIEVKNAGHFVLIEQPDIMAHHFRNWLGSE